MQADKDDMTQEFTPSDRNWTPPKERLFGIQQPKFQISLLLVVVLYVYFKNHLEISSSLRWLPLNLFEWHGVSVASFHWRLPCPQASPATDTD